MKFLFGLAYLALTVTAAPAVALDNGDFEKGGRDLPAGWKIEGSGVSVEPVAQAVWSRRHMIFNAGEYSRVRVWLGIKGGAGSMWFDNVRLEESEFSNQIITNRSFEEGDAKTITGWLQDPPNGSARDTTRWERFPGQAEGKGASARVTSADGTKSRIGQDIRILGRNELNREFVLSFDWRAEQLKGQLSVEVYGIGADGQVGRQLAVAPLPTRFPVEKFGNYILAMSLAGPGEAGVSQPLELSAHDRKIPWRVSANVRVARLDKSTFALSVQPGGNSAGEVRCEINKADDLWQEISLNFVPGASVPQIALSIKGSGGVVYVDNVKVGPAEITPAPKRLDWLPVAESFPILKKLTVSVTGDGGTVVASAIRLFSESLKKQTGTELAWDPSHPTDKPDLELVVGSGGTTRREPESYRLQVNHERVRIDGADARGVLNGLMTLLDLVQRTPDGASVFLATKIDDAPDLPFRGEYWTGDGPGPNFQDWPASGLTTSSRALLDRLARLRYNAVFIENYPYYSLDNARARRQTEDFFAYARSLGIEPVPVLESFGHDSQILKIDPNIAEGNEVLNEKLKMTGTEAVALAHPNVIRTETTNIRITDETGARTFLEGPDYSVLPGEMGMGTNGFRSNAAPFQVLRAPGSRIADGATVLASYDYVSMATGDGTEPSYCPNEPRVYRIMTDAIQNTIRILHPKYMSIGHDEIMQMGTDSRCRNSGRSNAENFAKEVWELYRIAKAEDPKLILMMWDDMINPYSHGYFSNYPELAESLKSPFLQAGQLLKDPTAPAADLLPRDIVINLWLYGETDALTAGLKSLEFFSKKGYPTIGSPYARLENARGWSIACKRVRDQGFPCMGVLHTSWSERLDTLDESAYTSWRVPLEP
jgi:hypothetical protein